MEMITKTLLISGELVYGLDPNTGSDESEYTMNTVLNVVGALGECIKFR